jgi:protein transport protein SEC13
MQVWRCDQNSGNWQQDGATLVGHTDWVRDVAWAPNLGLPKTVIASAGQDGKVLIWTESRDVPGQWSPALLHDFKVQLHVHWELMRSSAPS